MSAPWRGRPSRPARRALVGAASWSPRSCGRSRSEPPCPKALGEAADEQPSPVVGEALRTLSICLMRGSALSDALENVGPAGGATPRRPCGRGERSGRLVEALQALERVLEEEAVLLVRMRDAWIQPAITLAAAAVVGVVLLAGPLATIVSLREPQGDGSGLWMMDALAAHPAATAVGGLVLFVLVVLVLRAAFGSARARGWLPFLDAVRWEGRQALVARALSHLIGAEVPLPEATAAVARLLGPHDRERAAFERTAARLDAGDSIEEATLAAPELGPLLRAVLAGGNREAVATGLDRVATFHEWELVRRGEIVRDASELVRPRRWCRHGPVVIGTWASYFGSAGSMSW